MNSTIAESDSRFEGLGFCADGRLILRADRRSPVEDFELYRFILLSDQKEYIVTGYSGNHPKFRTVRSEDRLVEWVGAGFRASERANNTNGLVEGEIIFEFSRQFPRYLVLRFNQIPFTAFANLRAFAHSICVCDKMDSN